MATRHGDAAAIRDCARLCGGKLRKAIGKARIGTMRGGGVDDAARAVFKRVYQLTAGVVRQAKEGDIRFPGHCHARGQALALIPGQGKERQLLPPG